MQRFALKQLLEWKNSTRRKPLVLKGARQVGKTWLMKEFGRLHYQKTFYFSFDRDASLANLFKTTKDPIRLLEQLGAIQGDKILPGEHLVILDEIQECPEALNALKYFNEEANEFHVMAAGSLLGTLLASPHGYPVGKVNLQKINPMTFGEFLEAVQPSLANYLDSASDFTQIPEIQHRKLIECYRTYLIVGGMPDCVAAWVNEKDCRQVQLIQKELLSLYENDVSKYHGKVNAGRILMVFRNVATQLSKENEKFIYGCVKPGARAREFEEAIEWLTSAGLINRVYNVSKPEHPLNVFEQINAFKLFFFDTGLLKCLSGTSNQSIILDEAFQFKGALTENFVLQQLLSVLGENLHYYAPRQNYEVDFLLQEGSEIIPIECKGGENVASASFKRFIREKNPTRAFRFSQLPYKAQEIMTNIPLYLADRAVLLSAEDSH